MHVAVGKESTSPLQTTNGLKIHIFGASGSGTTTLADVLETKLEFKHLDIDHYYWVKTDPPFQEKVPFEERNYQLTKDFEQLDKVVVSGSLVSWGKAWHSAFHLGVFLHVPANIRMKRLLEREFERYGIKLYQDKTIQKNSDAFLKWASKYDDPSFDGRNISLHQNWIQELSFPVLQIEGDTSIEGKIQLILDKIESLGIL